MPSRTVVIAPDSFTGTASAIEVARALAEGWASVHPDDILRLLPMADGGEGTLEAFEMAVPGTRRRPVTVQGPHGRPGHRTVRTAVRTIERSTRGGCSCPAARVSSNWPTPAESRCCIR